MQIEVELLIRHPRSLFGEPASHLSIDAIRLRDGQPRSFYVGLAVVSVEACLGHGSNLLLRALGEALERLARILADQ